MLTHALYLSVTAVESALPTLQILLSYYLALMAKDYGLMTTSQDV